MTQGHPHAELAIQYWTLALTDPEPWKRLRRRQVGTKIWMSPESHPFFDESWEYEIIPPTVSINGHEFPEPLRVAPAVGTRYWTAQPEFDELAYPLTWSNDRLDRHYLRRGRIHLTQEAAEAHSRADILAAGGEV